MKKLPYIEDYILLMLQDPLTWPPRTPLIKLARYDEPIVNSMADQISRNISFTDRQSVLAHKIVTKYRKQWSAAGYDVTDHIDKPQYRLSIRQVDRRKIIDVVDGLIHLRFPYDQELISRIRAAVTDIPGRLQWNPDLHSWICALIEPRIIWAKEFGLENGFEFGENFTLNLQTVLDTADYSIKLVENDNCFSITNAEISLNEYVEEHIGFDLDKMLALTDASAILAYTVDENIKEYLRERYNQNILSFILDKTVNMSFTKSLDSLKDVVDYAKLTNRLPIYVYESGSQVLRSEISKYFSDDQILSKGHHLIPVEEYSQYSVIYYTNWKVIKNKMPLLVTLHTLTIGIRRQQVADLAEKVITYTYVAENELL